MSYENSIHSREVVRSLDGFPVKLYNFRSAFETHAFKDTRSTKQYLLDILNKQLIDSSKRYTFGIGMSWGQKDEQSRAAIARRPIKAIDLFRYSRESGWDINPSIEGRTYKDTNLDTEKEITCETGAIVLGEEAKLRRRSKNLDEFISSWPDLSSLKLIAPQTR